MKPSTIKKNSFSFKMKTKLPIIPETAIMQSNIALHSQDDSIYSGSELESDSESDSEDEANQLNQALHTYESDEDDYDVVDCMITKYNAGLARTRSPLPRYCYSDSESDFEDEANQLN